MPARSTSPSQAAPKRARRAAARRGARQASGSTSRTHSSQARSRSPRSGGARRAGAELPPTVSGVLARLGRAVAAGDLPTVSLCFAYPSLLLTGADTHEFRDPLQVQTVFRETLLANTEAGVASLTPRVEHAADHGHGVFACDVRWAETGERAHYVIQESAVGTALIRVAVASGK